MAILTVTGVLIWAVLAFGAVYPWASWPMATAIAAIAAWRWRPQLPRGAVAWAVILVVAAVVAQLIPIATSLMTSTSPAAAAFLSTFSVPYANGFVQHHALSIDPAETLRGLGFLVLCIVWVPTCVSVLAEANAPRTLARNVAIVGTIVGILGLAQHATFNGKLLWFWTPMFFATNGFGPFVNRNHFAGWMLLALALGIGLLFAQVNRLAPRRDADWRERLLWLGSPAASPLLLLSAGVLVMACSLVWTMSRSGIAAAGVCLTIMLGAALRRMRGSVQRWALAGYVVLIVVGVVTWRGTDRLVDWYGNTGTLRWRLQLWQDTLPAAKAFWLTGSGLNTYGTLMMVQPRTDLTVQPRQAHNDYLQLAVEGGVLLCIPAMLLVLALGRAIVQSLKAPQDDGIWWIRMGAVAGMCGMAVQEISEFSLQIPAVALLFATCLAIALHPASPASGRRVARNERRRELTAVRAA
jgi:O-antigen ligase